MKSRIKKNKKPKGFNHSSDSSLFDEKSCGKKKLTKSKLTISGQIEPLN